MTPFVRHKYATFILLTTTCLLLFASCKSEKTTADVKSAEVMQPVVEPIQETWLAPLPEKATLKVENPEAPDQSYTLTKQGDLWNIESQSLGEGNKPLRESMAQKLTTIFKSPILRVTKDEDLTTAEKYGLGPRQRQKVSISHDGKEVQSFWLGKTLIDPEEKVKRTYILSPDEQHLYKLRTDLGEILATSPYKLRTKDIFKVDPGKIQSISSSFGVVDETPVPEIYLLEREGQGWKDAQQPDKEISQTLVNSIVGQMANLHSDEFIPPYPSFDAVAPQDLREVVITTNDTKPHKFIFAKVILDNKPVTIIKDSENNTFALAPADPAYYAFFEPGDLRDRKAREFPLDSVKEIRFPAAYPVVVNPGPTFSKDNFDWVQTSPQPGGKVPFNSVRKSVYATISVLPDRMSDTSLDAAGLSPANPAEILEIRFKDGSRKQLVFGKESDRKDGYYAAWQDNSEVFVINHRLYKILHPTEGTFIQKP